MDSQGICKIVTHFDVMSLMTPGVVLYCVASAKMDAIPTEGRVNMELKGQTLLAHQCPNQSRER